MKVLIFVLVVYVVGDNQWRDWSSYSRLSECEEVIAVITHHREDKMQAVCEAREVDVSKHKD